MNICFSGKGQPFRKIIPLLSAFQNNSLEIAYAKADTYIIANHERIAIISMIDIILKI